MLMSQCGNNNKLALKYGGFCTMSSFVAKGLLQQEDVIKFQYIYFAPLAYNTISRETNIRLTL